MKKLFSAVLFFCLTTFFVQPSAHAALILSQDYYAYDNDNLLQLIGTVSVNVDESEEWVAPDYFSLNWLTLEFFGVSFTQTLEDSFRADFTLDNLSAGFSFLSFEVLDVFSNSYIQFYYDADLSFGFADIFQNGDGFAFEAIAGDARVTVPAPATVFLMLTCLVGLGLSRRRKL